MFTCRLYSKRASGMFLYCFSETANPPVYLYALCIPFVGEKNKKYTNHVDLFIAFSDKQLGLFQTTRTRACSHK